MSDQARFHAGPPKSRAPADRAVFFENAAAVTTRGKPFFDAQDEIDARNEALIGEIEAKLKQSVEINELFTVRWRIGRYEKRGSGVYNVSRYLPIYTPGAEPVFEEFADIFETTIPLVNSVEKSDSRDDKGQVTGEVAGEVLQFLRVLANGACNRSNAQAKIGLKGQSNFRERYLGPAMKAGLVEMTIPDKPRSRLQKYRLTDKGRETLANQA